MNVQLKGLCLPLLQHDLLSPPSRKQPWAVDYKHPSQERWACFPTLSLSLKSISSQHQEGNSQWKEGVGNSEILGWPRNCAEQAWQQRAVNSRQVVWLCRQAGSLQEQGLVTAKETHRKPAHQGIKLGHENQEVKLTDVNFTAQAGLPKGSSISGEKAFGCLKKKKQHPSHHRRGISATSISA